MASDEHFWKSFTLRDVLWIISLIVAATFTVASFATKTDLRDARVEIKGEIKDAVSVHERWEREKLDPMLRDIEEMRKDLKEAIKRR